MNESPSRPDRLTILHTESSCGWGGQELRILTESEGMLARGHHVKIACVPGSPIEADARRRGIDFVPLPIGQRNFTGLSAARSHLKQSPPDIVNTHSSTDSWLFSIAANTPWRRVPVVRTRHISTPVHRDWATRWLYTRGCRHIVITGEKLRQTLINRNRFRADRITSIPTGVDTSRFTPIAGESAREALRRGLGLPGGAIVVGIVATIRSWKGHRYLIEALKQLDRQNVHLLIVGDGPVRDRVEQQVDDLTMTSRVTFAGNQQDVVPYLQAMDVFALPSYANEGVPQSIMQAASCGLPVVSTNVGGIEEAVADGRTGVIVPPRQPQTLASAIGKLIDDKDLRRRFGASGRQKALSEFSFEQMIDRMERVFLSVSGALTASIHRRAA